MNQKGFSLLELTVIIFIVGVASAIVVTQYSKSRDAKALYLGSKQIANDIRMAQNYTFGALKNGGGSPSGGYGIRFSKDSNSYLIFADRDVPPDPPNKTYDTGEDYQTMNLPNRVEIKSLKIGANSYDDLDIIFTSPYGKVFINGDHKNGSDNFINLAVEIGNDSGTEIINISSSGIIN